jgi:crotonobetainyl-CoA:carnitine CoA-transferase CaiB-like acyl-CoA transferase
MERLGFGYAALAQLNPRLVYVSHKGFLPGPYDHRTALDEVVQMMGGLAYMTGPIGRPLRAGSSVNDIMGGMFGAIGVLAALGARHKTGKGQQVQSALFENNVFLVAQHMMQTAVMGKPPEPMPSRISPWAVYDVFTVADDEQIFLAVVSDTQWAVFCEAFGYADLKADPRLATNSLRVAHRDTMIPLLRERLARRSAAELAAMFEKEGLPYAPIVRPEDLFDDPHLLATGGLAPVTVPADGSLAGREIETRTALLPLTLAASDWRCACRRRASAGTRARSSPTWATAAPTSPRCTPTAWSARTRNRHRPLRSRRRLRRKRRRLGDRKTSRGLASRLRASRRGR